MIPMNVYPASSVVPIFFTSYGKTNGESITLTGLAVTDIKIYKGTSMTQRSSDAGYALLDTDGIDVDGVIGLHGFSIDLGDNTDAGFYAVGSFYTVVVSAVTIDAQTVTFIADRFRIVAAEAITGKPKVDVDGWLGTAAATPTVAGVPEVDVTHWIGTAAATPTVAGVPEVDITHLGGVAQSLTDLKDFADTGYNPVTHYIAGIDGTLNQLDDLNNAVTAPTAAANADAVWDEDTTGHTTAGTFGQQCKTDIDDILTDTGTTLDGRIPAALTADGNVKADALRVNGTAQTAGDLAALINALSVYTTRVVARCTASGVPTTTSIPTSACSPSGAVADQFRGRIIIFDAATTTAALHGQATDITASSNAATPTFTVTALTTAPVSGDTFSIV